MRQEKSNCVILGLCGTNGHCRGGKISLHYWQGKKEGGVHRTKSALWVEIARYDFSQRVNGGIEIILQSSIWTNTSTLLMGRVGFPKVYNAPQKRLYVLR